MNRCKSIAEVLVNIKYPKVLPKNSIFSVIKDRWVDICDVSYINYVFPQKYHSSSLCLTLESILPSIHVNHLSDSIINNCKNILGSDDIQSVRFIFKN